MAHPPELPAAIQQKLASRGLSAERPLDALDALAATWGSDPELEAALVALAGGSDDAAAGDLLSRLAATTRDKHVKREIKRALYKLEQRGRWHAPAAAPPPPVRDLLGPGEDEPEAWVSAIDPSGSRLLWMARRSGAGMASLSALIDETRGLVEFYAGETTRKALRQAQRELSGRNGVALVEAPWQHVDALLTRATAIAANETRSADVARARREIVPHPHIGAVPPPVDALLDRAAASADPAALEASARVLAERELGGWLLPRDWVEPALQVIEDAQSSVVIVSPQQHEERLREALLRAAEDVFAADERRALFAARFEESAYLLARRGADAAARALVAATDAIRAGRPVAQIPVLAQLAARSFALALELRARQSREEAKSSLVVTPQQALAEQQRLAARRPR